MFHKRRSTKVRPYRPILQVLGARNLLSTYLVDHLADDGIGMGLSGSLRYAITHAVDGDTINFGVNGTINLSDALPDLTHNISINGPGPNLLTVRRNGNIYDFPWYRIFTVPAGATVSISGLTITNGVSEDEFGGGISNAGTVTLSNSTVTGNTAYEFGGGISNAGTLTLSNSTVTGNGVNTCPIGCSEPPPGAGGGIFNGNLSGTAILTISNSTISGNHTSGGADGSYGGGIANGIDTGMGYYVPAGTVTLRNSTVYYNRATTGGYRAGGGIYHGRGGGSLLVTNSTIAANRVATGSGGGIFSDGPLTMRNTILANNTGGCPDICGSLASWGYNLIGNSQCGSGFHDTDLLNVDPLLGPLQNNGGPTQTMALLAGSPALNAGDPAQLGVADQRGVIRAGGVNIGAYQASASAFVLTAPATVTASVPFDVTVTAVDRFGQVALGYTGTVTFSTSDPDPGVVLPADYSFTADDQGTHTFSGGFTLMTPGDQTLTAADADGGFGASAVVTVDGGGGAPGRYHEAGGVDALFAALAAEWERRRLGGRGGLSLDALNEV